MRKNLINCLEATADYIRRNQGASPSIEQLSELLGVTKPTVMRGLRDLHDAGYIDRIERKHRRIEITAKGKAFLEERF